MNVAILWDAVQCGPYMNQLFGGNITSIFRIENHRARHQHLGGC
jgi:hypothetical protein